MQEINKDDLYSSLPTRAEPERSVLFPSPNNPPWTSPTAFGVWVVSVLFVLVIPSLFLFPYLLTRTPPITRPEEIVEYAKTDPTSVFLQMAAIIPAHILTLVLAWLVVTRGRRYAVRDTVGLEKGGFRWWHYPLILGGFFAVAAVVGWFFPEQENELIRILRSSRAAVYIVAFLATFTAPIAEEIVYRGILYSAFQRTFGVTAAFLLVTFLFALVHVPQYYPSYSTIFLLTLLSVILTLIRVRSG
ncbi:MAG TPA: type II CAAX endopeptidase family protein, partial [Pyrinomonadaceae bacterium]|nr:type II CAAX endopeptidase family protein [Pyrinomonadaceae bacterium]